MTFINDPTILYMTARKFAKTILILAKTSSNPHTAWYTPEVTEACKFLGYDPISLAVLSAQDIMALS